MPMLNFLTNKRNQHRAPKPDPQKGEAISLTPNQKATLEAIRRYEDRMSPRLRDTKRIYTGLRGETIPEEERLLELKKYLLKTKRESQRVRARFAVRLAPAIARHIEEVGATAVELRSSDHQQLVLTLLRLDPTDEGAPTRLRSYNIVPIRERNAAGDQPTGSRLRLQIGEEDSQLELVVAPKGIPTRLRARTGTDQGAVQYRFHQLQNSYKRRLKKPAQVTSSGTKAKVLKPQEK